MVPLQRGVVTIILFQGQRMFPCQERRALPKALGDKGAGLECSTAIYASSAPHLSPVPFNREHFCSSTEQPGPVFITACV